MKTNCVQDRIIELLSIYPGGLQALTMAIIINRNFPSITDSMVDNALNSLCERSIIEFKTKEMRYFLSPLHLLATIE